MNQFLYRETDNVWLVFLRIAIGLLALVEACIQFFYFHLHKGAFDCTRFQFNYIGFEWLDPLPEPFMSLFFCFLILASLGILFGAFYRYSTIVYAVGITYIFLLEKSHYLNHGYLLCLLSFVLILLPAHKRFSFDVLFRQVIHRKTCFYYERWILPFTMGVVYFFGGIAKINSDWLKAQPLQLWMRYKAQTHFLGDWLEAAFLPWFLSYGGLFFDLTIAFLLLGKKTRIPALLAVLFFHLTNFIIFEIGIFPWLSIALSLSFLPSSYCWNAASWLEKKLRFVYRLRVKYRALRLQYAAPFVPVSMPGPRVRFLIYSSLTIYLLYHMIMPLRHHAFPGDVAWTEEGHRYAWRMMLRSKTGYGIFIVESGDGSKKERVKPADHLYGKQTRKLYTHPDMIWQFARYLEDLYEEKGWSDIAVYADIRVKLNDGSYYRYIDPAVDLSEVPWEFLASSDWILPEGASD